MAKWLNKVLRRIRESALQRRLSITAKAAREIAALGLDPEDVREVLTGLRTSDSAGRQISVVTGEWMYVFKRLSFCRFTRMNMRKTSSAARNGAGKSSRVLPGNACPACGTMMKETRGRIHLPVNGEEIMVPSAPHLRCPNCGETLLRFHDARRLHEDAASIYRSKHGLLSATQIRDLRARLGFKQADLARLLRLGANTISRWESGRNVQTAAMDILLRLLRDLPGSVDYLREHAA